MKLLRTFFLILILSSVTACDGPLSLLTGGGPNVAANVQAGQENNQTLLDVGATTTEQTIVRPNARDITQTSDENRIKTEKVENLTLNESPPLWVWLLMILGWLLPSPGEMGRTIRGWFRKD